MATLQRRMWAFEMIDVCDKVLNAISGFVDVLIVVKVNFFFLEGCGSTVQRIRSPKGVLYVRPKSQRHAASALRYSRLKDTARLDRSDESREPCRVKLALRGARSKIASSVD